MVPKMLVTPVFISFSHTGDLRHKSDKLDKGAFNFALEELAELGHCASHSIVLNNNREVEGDHLANFLEKTLNGFGLTGCSTPVTGEALLHARSALSYQNDFGAFEGVIQMIFGHLTDAQQCHKPIVILGSPEGGRTHVLAQVANRIDETLGLPCVCVLRCDPLCGNSKDIQNMLSSICKQICAAYCMDQPSSDDLATKFNAFKCFGAILQQVSDSLSAENPLVILLDGIENQFTSDEYHAFQWISRNGMPHNVHLLVTLNPANTDAVAQFKKHLVDCYKEVPVEFNLADKALAQNAICKHLDHNGLRLTKKQKSAILDKLSKCQHSLHMSLILEMVKKRPGLLSKSTSLTKFPEMVKYYLGQMEEVFPPKFLKSVLQFLTFAEPLQLDELVRLMSSHGDLDTDSVGVMEVNGVTLLITHLKNKLHPLLRATVRDGAVIMQWRNTVLPGIVRDYSGNDDSHQDFQHECNKCLIKMHLNLPEDGVQNLEILFIREHLETLRTRALKLLPLVIYSSGWPAEGSDSLKAYILCNVHWIVEKLKRTSFECVLLDFDLLGDDDQEILLIKKLLTACRTSLTIDPESLYTEITLRLPQSFPLFKWLSKLAMDSYEHLWSRSSTGLIPIHPGLAPPDCALQKELPGPMYLLGFNQKSEGIIWNEDFGLQTWDLATGCAKQHLCNPPNIYCLQLSPNKELVVTVDGPNLIIVDTTSGEMVHRIALVPELEATPLQGAPILWPMAVSEDSTLIAVLINKKELAEDGNCLLVLRMTENSCEVINRVGQGLYPERLTNVLFFQSEDRTGMLIAHTLGLDDTPSILLMHDDIRDPDTEPQTQVFPKDVFIPPLALKMSNDGTKVAVLCQPDSITVLTLPDQALVFQDIKEKSCKSRMVDLHWVSDCKILTVSYDGSTHNTALHALTSDGVTIWTSESHSKKPDTVFCFQKENFACIAYEKPCGVVEMWQLTTGDLLKEFKAHSAEVNSIVYPGGSPFIYTASKDHTVKKWMLHVLLPSTQKATQLDPAAEQGLQLMEDLRSIQAEINNKVTAISKLYLGNSSYVVALHQEVPPSVLNDQAKLVDVFPAISNQREYLMEGRIF